MRYFLLVLLFWGGACFSQNVPRIQHINVEDGLSQSSVYSIFQDRFGFMWFATGDGLNRFDGKEFIYYKSKLDKSGAGTLKDRNINSVIFEDLNNNLWFSADEGVYCMNRRSGAFTVRLTKFETWYAASVAGADSSAVWVIVPGKGIYSMSLVNEQRRLYPFTDTFQLSSRVKTLVKNGFNTNEGIWIADIKGLLHFDKKSLREKRTLLKDGINGVSLLSNGRLFLTADGGVYFFNPGDNELAFTPTIGSNGENLSWRSAIEDTASGCVYMGADLGGYVGKLNLRTRAFELITFQDNRINGLYIDRSRNLWVGTEGGGVYRMDIKPPKFKTYSPVRYSKEACMVKSVYKDDSGVIWMALFDRGIFKYNPLTGSEHAVYPSKAYGGTHFGSLMKDSSGLMVATIDDKIVWLDPLSGAIKKEVVLPFYAYVSSSKPVIYAISEWEKGHFVIGTDLGLYSISDVSGSPKDVKMYAWFNSGTVTGWTYNLSNNNDGTIYVGKRNGFARLRIISDSTREILDNGEASIPIRHFYKSSFHNILWLASEQGLVAYNEITKKYIVFDETSGLANSYIYAILPQNDSTLWVSTNAGISCVQVSYGEHDTVFAKFNNYSNKDGLQSNEFNTGAFHKSTDGTMIFGGIAGMNWFKPEDIIPNPYHAYPAITSVSVDDTLIATDTAMYMKSLELPYYRNTVGFTIRALEYTLPDQNMYAYMLEGLDKDWVYTTSDKVRYSNLSPGVYTFLLKVRNNETLWTEDPLGFKITIWPPYWQTWWFRSLVFLLCSAAVFAVARYYIHQRVLAKTRELEKIHALNMERIRISKDVHDDIGSGLSKISLHSAIASRKIGENEVPAKDIAHIAHISKELVDNMRDLIWVLNPENTTLENLVSRIREYCSDYLDGMDVKPVYDIPLTLPEMDISREVQRNIFLTIKEVVNNCAKYANASELEIAITLNDAFFVVCMVDNGIGFDQVGARKGGNGLRNMKHRIELIGGVCEISSAAGMGTSVKLSIPINMLQSHAV